MPEPDRASVNAAALVEACTIGSAAGPCALTSREETIAGAERDAPALAIVAWSADHGAVRIEVGIRRDGQPAWYTRRLAFRPEDAERERWRSAGLVIATLAGDARAGTAGEAAIAPSPPDGSAPPSVAPVPPRASSSVPRQPASVVRRASPTGDVVPPPGRFAIDALALTGPAFDGGSWRFGGALRAALAIRRPVYVTASTRASLRPADAGGVSATWIGGAIGFGASTAVARALVVEGRVEAGAQLLHASAHDAATDRSDGGARGAAWGIATADAVWRVTPLVGVVGGTDLLVVPGATDLRVGGAEVAREPTVTFTLHLGARISPW